MRNRLLLKPAQPRYAAARPRGMRLPRWCAPGTTFTPGRLRGHGGGGLRRYALDDGTGRRRRRGRAAVAGGRRCPRRGSVPSRTRRPILRAFVVPPGGQRLQKAPAVLRVPYSIIVSTALVDDVSFGRAPGQPQAVLAWEQAHLPRRFRPEGADGPSTWDRTFSEAPIPGVLKRPGPGGRGGRSGRRADRGPGGRSGELAAAPAGHRTGAVRRPRCQDHPAAQRGPYAGRPPAPVTITDLAVVRRLAALVDSLQLSTIGPDATCPAGFGGGIRLTFLARAGDPPLAVAQGPARLRHRSVQRRRQAAARAPDHRLVHPAGPQARRPALEGLVARTRGSGAKDEVAGMTARYRGTGRADRWNVLAPAGAVIAEGVEQWQSAGQAVLFLSGGALLGKVVTSPEK